MPAIEEFAAHLVLSVRDEAIRACDAAYAWGRDARSKRWQKVVPHGSDGLAIVNTLIPDVVDEVLFQLLHAIDEGTLRLSFTSEEGVTVDLIEEGLGELGGWYAGSGDGAWIGRFSRERRNDYLKGAPPESEAE